MNNNIQTYTTASLPKRLAAMLYDTLLLFGIMFTATLIPSLLLTTTPSQAPGDGDVVHELHPLMEGLSFQLYLLSILVLFFCWFWGKSGQTLGMQAWRLKVITDSGELLSWRQSLIRLAAACLSILCLGMGYWWVLIDRDNLSWHDRLSKTRIAVLPKDKK